MTIIGVTGDFCSGKSTVCGFFKNLGCSLIDADKIVHLLYKNDNEIKKAIRRAFGDDVFKGGVIERKGLAKKALKSKKYLDKLCKIVHPKTINSIKDKIKKARGCPAVIDAPLLIESKLCKLVDCIVLVRTSKKTLSTRCKKRGFDKEDLKKRLAFQMPFSKKSKHADFIIDNNGSKNETKKGVLIIWKQINRGWKKWRI